MEHTSSTCRSQILVPSRKALVSQPVSHFPSRGVRGAGFLGYRTFRTASLRHWEYALFRISNVKGTTRSPLDVPPPVEIQNLQRLCHSSRIQSRAEVEPELGVEGNPFRFSWQEFGFVGQASVIEKCAGKEFSRYDRITYSTEANEGECESRCQGKTVEVARIIAVERIRPLLHRVCR